MNHIKYLLATIAAFTFVMLIIMAPVLVKAEEIPEGLYEKQVDFNLGCTKGFIPMMAFLFETYKEAPVVMSHLDQYTTFVLFANKEKTTSTLVITKQMKHEEEACIIWGGQSNGTSLSINPNPIYPKDGTGA